MKKKLTAFTVIVLLLILTMSLAAAPAWASDLPKVVDEADLLASYEEQELEAFLQETGDKYGLDIVAVTVNTYTESDIGKFTEKYYDDNGYGFDAEGSGVIMLIAIDDGEFYIDRVGYALDMISDSDWQAVENDVVEYLSDGDFAGGFKRFGEMTGEICEEYQNYGPSYPPGPEGPTKPDKGEYPLAANLGISGALGALVSAISTGRNKSRLKSVRSKNQASDYVREDSLALSDNRDLYLYSQVTRVPRPKNNEQMGGAGTVAAGGAIAHGMNQGHGGSTFHTTSSGRRHGGTGGSFRGGSRGGGGKGRRF